LIRQRKIGSPLSLSPAYPVSLHFCLDSLPLFNALSNLSQHYLERAQVSFATNELQSARWTFFEGQNFGMNDSLYTLYLDGSECFASYEKLYGN